MYQQRTFNQQQLQALLASFRQAVKRTVPNDAVLADEIEHDLYATQRGTLSDSTLKRLARWCKTDGNLYSDGMLVAQKISELLYGTVVDRTLLKT